MAATPRAQQPRHALPEAATARRSVASFCICRCLMQLCVRRKGALVITTPPGARLRRDSVYELKNSSASEKTTQNSRYTCHVLWHVYFFCFSVCAWVTMSELAWLRSHRDVITISRSLLLCLTQNCYRPPAAPWLLLSAGRDLLKTRFRPSALACLAEESNLKGSKKHQSWPHCARPSFFSIPVGRHRSHTVSAC